MKRLIIIDGHTFIFKAYYAFQSAGLTNSKTEKPSGATFGFFKMIFKILQDNHPSHFMIIFDSGTRLKRNDLYELYKANRKKMPQEFKDQVVEIKEIVQNIDFFSIQEEGEEADDLIASVCLKYKEIAEEIFIFSSDKDLYQVLSKNIFMFRGKKGVSEFIKIDPIWVEKELQIKMKQVLDYMAIVGDTADNIPGVKGIGKKGATDLIKKFGSLNVIYKNLPLVEQKSLRMKLEENREMAFLSKKLCSLNDKIPLYFSDEDLILKKYYEKSDYFKDLGYNHLSYTLKNFQVLQKKQNVQSFNQEKQYHLIDTEKDLKKLIQKMENVEVIAIDTETTSLSFFQAELVGISLSFQKDEGFYIPIKNTFSLDSFQIFDLKLIQNILNPIFQNEKILKVGQNIKYDWLILESHGFSLKGVIFDTMLASYVLQPAEKHSLDRLAEKHLSYQTIKYHEIVGSGKNEKNMGEIEPKKIKNYASEDADITFRLFQVLKPKIEQNNLDYVFSSIEMPLVKVLKKIEFKGVFIEKKHFQSLSEKYQKQAEKTEQEIFDMIGEKFNIASNPELQHILFEKLKLSPTKKTTKSQGFSTDKNVLEELSDKHPVIEKILDFRKFSKLNSTYCQSLLKIINLKTNRVHTNYNQTITVTGRLSSHNPNLQNIPIREKEGKEIREGFTVESEDYTLLSLDYSQIELRIMAHISNDPMMIQAYQENKDIHKITASEIFNLPENEIDFEMRNQAKVVNFSVIYGITARSLSKKLKIDYKQAKDFIHSYKNRYSKVKQYMEDMPKFAREKGYVETVFKRKRFISDENFSPRISINSPIQGTSADIIKLAMIEIDKEIEKRNLKSQIILQVHDELVFEVYKKEKEEIFELSKNLMENIVSLKVPLVVEGKFAKNWGLAH